MARVCRITLVCEGWEDSAFLEGFLASSGINKGIVCTKNPKGKGSGFDYVRKVFAEEVKALSRFQEGRGVLALMDEDGQGIVGRRDWVATQLSGLSLPQVDCKEGRCLILAKRNIETWVYWLTGARLNQDWEVSETENYKNRRPSGASRNLDNKDWREAGRKLQSINQTTPPVGMPPELVSSLGQLRSFVQAVRL